MGVAGRVSDVGPALRAPHLQNAADPRVAVLRRWIRTPRGSSGWPASRRNTRNQTREQPQHFEHRQRAGCRRCMRHSTSVLLFQIRFFDTNKDATRAFDADPRVRLVMLVVLTATIFGSLEAIREHWGSWSGPGHGRPCGLGLADPAARIATGAARRANPAAPCALLDHGARPRPLRRDRHRHRCPSISPWSGRVRRRVSDGARRRCPWIGPLSASGRGSRRRVPTAVGPS